MAAATTTITMATHAHYDDRRRGERQWYYQTARASKQWQ
jgi:hypothetical protein